MMWLTTVKSLVGGGGGGGGGGGSSSYKQPSGPAQTTVDIKGGNFFFDPKNPQAPAGVDAIKLTSEGGQHTLVFDGGKVPGFKLQANSGASARPMKMLAALGRTPRCSSGTPHALWPMAGAPVRSPDSGWTRPWTPSSPRSRRISMRAIGRGTSPSSKPMPAP